MKKMISFIFFNQLKNTENFVSSNFGKIKCIILTNKIITFSFSFSKKKSETKRSLNMINSSSNSTVKTVHLPEDVFRDFKEIDQQRKQNSEYQLLINSLHEKSDLNQEEKTKLCGLYKTSIETSRKEES